MEITGDNIPLSYTELLPMIVDKLLKSAELKYGPRVDNLVIKEICFKSDPRPSIFYESNQIKIIIPANCKCDLSMIAYHLAHELIHCLGSNYSKDVTVLEEGIACQFQLECTGGKKLKTSLLKYINALNLFNKLYEIDNFIVKKVREVQPVISKITAEQLIEANSGIPISLAKDLTALFND